MRRLFARFLLLAMLPLLGAGAGSNVSVGKHRFIAPGGSTPAYVTGSTIAVSQGSSGVAQSLGFTTGAGDFIVLVDTGNTYVATTYKLGSNSMTICSGCSYNPGSHGYIILATYYDASGGNTQFTFTCSSCGTYFHEIGIMEFSGTASSVAAVGTFESNQLSFAAHTTWSGTPNYSPGANVLAIGVGNVASATMTAQAASAPWAQGPIHTSSASWQSLNLMYQLSTSSATAAAGTQAGGGSTYVNIMTGGFQ